jgi:cyclopropane fatty-acyl-phospholipid synthase-like methyltransferase
VVLDLPGAVEQGKSIVREKGFEDRVRFRQGDLKITEWGKGYDLVLLFNIIHTVSPEEAPRILARAYQSLNPGGTVVILDSEHTGNEKDLSATSGFNELLFFIINGTCVYPEKDIRKWMTDAGFINLKKKKLLIMPMTLFITGRKPS